jgi:hypothetical protein
MGINTERLTYESRTPNRDIDAAKVVKDNNSYRKSGHGEGPVDVVGLDMQTPRKASSLAVA